VEKEESTDIEKGRKLQMHRLVAGAAASARLVADYTLLVGAMVFIPSGPSAIVGQLELH
jgi:hypothetical protein